MALIASPEERRVTGRRQDVVLGSATVAMGLIAGLFYAFACAVMPGLRESTDRTVIEAMQRINRAIENPVFFATFLGAPALGALALVLERRQGSTIVARWILAGVALYAMCFIVTMSINVPMNIRLDHAGDPSRIADLAEVREEFEGPWITWNIVRTLAAIAGFGCLARAVFLRGRLTR